MQKNIKRLREPEQIGYSSSHQTFIVNDSQNADESQQALSIPSLESSYLKNRGSRLLELLNVIIYLATLLLLTLPALVRQNLILLSSIPTLVRELTYTFRRAVDFLSPKRLCATYLKTP